MIGLLGLWRYGLIAALLVAAGVWYTADKSRAVDDAVEVVRAEYIAAALVASESARAKEKQLTAATQKVSHDFQIQKTRNAAAAVATSDKLRDLETALADSAASADTPSTSGIDGTFAAIAIECGRALVEMDDYAAKLASTARALQQYAASLQLSQ